MNKEFRSYLKGQLRKAKTLEDKKNVQEKVKKDYTIWKNFTSPTEKKSYYKAWGKLK